MPNTNCSAGASVAGASVAGASVAAGSSVAGGSVAAGGSVTAGAWVVAGAPHAVRTSVNTIVKNRNLRIFFFSLCESGLKQMACKQQWFSQCTSFHGLLSTQLYILVLFTYCMTDYCAEIIAFLMNYMRIGS